MVRLTIPLASQATKISPRATQLETELESRLEADPKLLLLEVNTRLFQKYIYFCPFCDDKSPQ